MSSSSKNTILDDAKDSVVPTKMYTDITSIKNDTLNKHDLLIYLNSIVEQNGLIGHNLEGYNELVESGINEIMTELFGINRPIPNEREGDGIKSFGIHVKFHNAKVGKPICSTYVPGKFEELFPATARITGLPYSGAITLQASVHLIANYEDGHIEEKITEVPTFKIGDFPIMVGSVKCNTYNVTKNALKELKEDPNDLGGYFIAKRGEYIVDLLENIRYNSIHTHIQMGYKEYVRSEFLSQPGSAFENSSMLTIRYNENGQITIEISSTISEKIRLPFYVIYRLFGMVSDEDISNTIVFDINDKSIITEKILEILENAFHLSDNPVLTYEIEREKLIYMIAEKAYKYLIIQKHNKTESDIQNINNHVLNNLDTVILPHIGKSAVSRIKKLRFIGLLIRKMLLVHFGVLPAIDRDSYRNKRVHGSGISLAKAFKTQVNNSIITPIFKEFKKELKTTPWNNINASIIISKFNNALVSSDLNKAMEQSITSGNKTIIIKRKAATNRVSSQALERKNILNMFSALRTVVTQNAGNSSKQTERADLMRRVHPTYTGYICVAQSADSGEKVGMRKQLAITANVCIATDAYRLKTILKEEIIPIEQVSSKDMLYKNLARIFINGDWIGCTNDAHSLVKKYRYLRREAKYVDPRTTIFWDTSINEVEFWLDVGRLTRPLLIVDSNIEEYDQSLRDIHDKKENAKRIDFVQNIRLLPEHITKLRNKEITFNNLLEEGIVEYIAPEEQENCLIAESIDELFKNKGNVTMRYTHCDIEQAILGLAALMSPYGNHTQPARITHSTNHARQSGGWYALNFPYRTDKNRFFQFYNEVPLVKTFSHNLIPSNGSNVIIAYASYGGDNQEDSAIVSQASVDRGLFNGAFFRYEMVELKKDESFTNPDINITKNLKPNASYEKLENGFIKKGSIVRYGDVIIGRVAKIIRLPTDQSIYQYIDRSVVYKLHEPAIVEDIIQPCNANIDKLGIVKLRYERPLLIGDKLSSRCGNKSIVSSMLQQSDMPFTESGLTPDIIINPHCIPTRMTVGQLIETTVSKICARRGSLTDGTPFLPIDHFKIIEELLQLGYRYNGQERMYNGQTGEYLNSSIFIGPNFEERIQKFVLDDEQVVAGSGHTDATTGQPLGGKHVQGGLRIGEMEVWALSSHGSMLNMYEKLSTDSDGRIVYVCRKCGNFAIYNEYKNIYKCITCEEDADIVAIDSSKTAILFAEELAASNISMRYGVVPREYEQYT
jgi:DNA-directed RNA polymerase II subunit RPB2